MKMEFKLDILTERRLVKHLKSLLHIIDLSSYNRIKEIIDKAISEHLITLQQINEILDILEKNNKIKPVNIDKDIEDKHKNKRVFSKTTVDNGFNIIQYQYDEEVRQFVKCLLFYKLVENNIPSISNARKHQHRN